MSTMRPGEYAKLEDVPEEIRNLPGFKVVTQKPILDVPDHDVAEVKALGAVWDKEENAWTVPITHDPSDFSCWARITGVDTMRASRYAIVAGPMECPYCDFPVMVSGFVFPEGHETVDTREGNEAEAVIATLKNPTNPDVAYRRVPEASIMGAFYRIDAAALSRMQVVNPAFRCGFVDDIEEWVFMNHCTECHAPIEHAYVAGEHGVFGEDMPLPPGKVTFMVVDQPMTGQEASIFEPPSPDVLRTIAELKAGAIPGGN